MASTITTKKYAARVRVSSGVMIYGRTPTNTSTYITVGYLMTSNKQLQDLLDQVAAGTLDPAAAKERLIGVLRAQPYEDLGFARVDHHRSVRQGFPEVILGLGKTPAQIAAIAAEIVARGSTLLVTRASAAAYEAVRALVPAAGYQPEAGLITLR